MSACCGLRALPSFRFHFQTQASRRYAHDHPTGARLSARVIDGRAVARRMRATLRDDVAEFTEANGAPPCLLAIGSAVDRAAETYLTLKRDAARNAGVRLVPLLLPGDARTEEAVAHVLRAADDANVHGIFVQYPLPGIDTRACFDSIPAHKDVDGASAESMRRLQAGQDSFVSASAAGIMALLADAGVALPGTRVFVGRGNPAIAEAVVILLERAGAQVVRLQRGADREAVRSALSVVTVVVFPAGIPPALEPAWLPGGGIVVDGGYFGFRRAGDAVLAEAAPRLAAYVPARGGVGPVTVEFLLRHTLAAARLQRA